jgi:hypothetical protein
VELADALLENGIQLLIGYEEVYEKLCRGNEYVQNACSSFIGVDMRGD